MSNASHTPGPWIARNSAGDTIAWLCDSEGKHFANLRSVRGADAISGRWAADKALMAAAPAMLAILRDVAVALDMADPESDNFADSGADVLQYLLENGGPDLMRLFLDLGEELDGSGPVASEGEC